MRGFVGSPSGISDYRQVGVGSLSAVFEQHPEIRHISCRLSLHPSIIVSVAKLGAHLRRRLLRQQDQAPQSGVFGRSDRARPLGELVLPHLHGHELERPTLCQGAASVRAPLGRGLCPPVVLAGRACASRRSVSSLSALRTLDGQLCVRNSGPEVQGRPLPQHVPTMPPRAWNRMKLAASGTK